MSIEVNLDVMLAKRKMSMTELSEKVGITMANLSILKTGKAKAIRFSTLEAICEALDCQPGDILEYVQEDDPCRSYESPFFTDCTEDEVGTLFRYESVCGLGSVEESLSGKAAGAYCNFRLVHIVSGSGKVIFKS